MLRLRSASVVGILGVVLSTWACGESPTAASTETFVQRTESYAGILNPGESMAFHFTVTNPGSLDVFISSLSPVSTLTMGLQMGSWEATAESCPQQIFTDAARVNLVLSGNPQRPGEYCVAIYDVGNMQSAAEFVLTVLHY